MTNRLGRWWSRLLNSPDRGVEAQTSSASSAEVDAPLEYPRGFTLSPSGGSPIFDPALKSHACAYREGDPPFSSDEDQSRWEAARLGLLDHMVRIVSRSEWSDQLMLRGSALLSRWLGPDARAPRDIDWVVLAQDWTVSGDEADVMLEGIARQFTAAGRVGDIVLDPSWVVRDPIWTYERADGVRLTFAGHVEGLPPLKLQCDFVFGEVLWQPPVVSEWPVSPDTSVSVLTASPEVSLAWKLMWLLTDQYPQGKDLYDAVLLAERHALPPDLFHRVVDVVSTNNGTWWRSIPSEQRVAELLSSKLGRVEWQGFVSEYPRIEPDPEIWVTRLRRAVPEVWEAHAWRS